MELLGAIFSLMGSLLMLVSAIGLLRFPDIYTRIHASSVAPSLALLLLLAAAICFFPTLWTAGFVILLILINFLTVPLTAHLIARVSYLTGLPLWKSPDKK